MIRKLSVIAIFVAAETVALCPGIRSVASAQTTFFPSRPPGATLHAVRGILTDFGIGNDEGGFTVLVGRRKYQLYVSGKFLINGQEAPCDHIPGQGRLQDPFCKWHSDIVLGKTLVATTYWPQRKPGEFGLVMVASDFRTLASPNGR